MKPSARFAPLAATSAVAVACLALIGSGVNLSAAQIPPSTPAMPPAGEGRLQWAAASEGDRPPEPEREPGTATVDCYRWPDGTWTQTGDRLSPSCLATWDFAAGNGGSTAPGVDGGVIRIGVGSADPVALAIADYINRTYQLYGRSIQLVELGGVQSPVQQAAFVANARSEEVFAATPSTISYNYPAADPDGLLTALADSGIIGMLNQPVQHSDTLTGNGPYAWTTREPLDRSQRWMGDMVCQMLKDRPVRFSTQNADAERKFAILAPSATALNGVAFDTSRIQDALSGCGVDAQRYEFNSEAVGAENDPRDEATYAQMRADGVTSILYFTLENSTLIRAQDLFGSYRPEIFTTGTLPTGNSFVQFPGDTQNIVSITDQWRDQLPEQTFSAQILSGIDFPAQGNFQARNSSQNMYRALATIAAGIQAAGPELTPGTFRAGLEAQYFPNPGKGAAPEYQGGIGFQLGDHVMVNDVALGVWNYDLIDPVGAAKNYKLPGTFCPVDGGARFGNGTPLPDSDDPLIPLMSGTCPAVPDAVPKDGGS